MKRAATIAAFIVLTGIALHGLLSPGMAQAPADPAPGAVGRFSLVATNANAQVKLFVIDTQTGRIWQSTQDNSWRQIQPPPVLPRREREPK